MKTTNSAIDLDLATDLASELGVVCTIDTDLTITLETGEIEPAAALEDAVRILRAYAQGSN